MVYARTPFLSAVFFPNSLKTRGKATKEFPGHIEFMWEDYEDARAGPMIRECRGEPRHAAHKNAA
jgi:hypothetical protein